MMTAAPIPRPKPRPPWPHRLIPNPHRCAPGSSL